MSVVHRPRAPRSLLVALAAALASSVLGVPGVAEAEAPTSATDTVVGELVQAWPDHADHDEAAERGDEGPLSFIRTASGDSVRVATDDVAALPVGATVEVTVGSPVSDAASREDGYEKARDVLAAEVLVQPPAPAPTAPAETGVDHPVTVVMAVPKGGTPDPTRIADVVATVNGPVADFWREQTDGSVRFGVVAQRDWVTLDVGCQDPSLLWSAAARAAGFTDVYGRPDHLLVYLASAPGCSDGLGTVGRERVSGGYSYVRYATTSIIAHELGHNMGLGHSSLRQCDQGVDRAACETTPYYDLYDVMGLSWGPLGSLNLPQAARLVPVQTRAIELDDGPATIALTPVSERSGVRGIVLRDTGGQTYWLEYRPASGRDAWLGTSANRMGLRSGVLLRQEGTGHDTSLLLDGTPSPPAGWGRDLDSVLPVGRAVRITDSAVSGGAFEITVVSTSPTSASVQVTPTSAITLAYGASGGAAGPMGAPTGAESCGTIVSLPACTRSFENGLIVWTPVVEDGAHLIRGPIHDVWRAAPEPYATFGFPTTDTTCDLPSGGCRQHFRNGNLYWSPASGAVEVRGLLRTAYLSLGQESGVIGYPTAAAVCGTADVCRQQFQGGVLVADPATGTRLLPTQVAAVWAAQGHEAGPLGRPVSGFVCGLKESGCVQAFQGGRVVSTPGTGTHAVSGALGTTWEQQGLERGALGYPTAGQVCGLAAAGCSQAFQGGALYWSPGTGAQAVSGAVVTAWTAAGAEGGALGYPTSPQFCGLPAGGCVQAFQGGRVYSAPGPGTHALTGAIQTAWAQQGYERGALGYPTGDQACGLADGGCRQAFQGGSLWTSPAGTHTVSGAIGTAWTAAGAEGGALRYPASPQFCGLKESGCVQAFQGGRIFGTPGTGAHPLTGTILAGWEAQGLERGPLGYATGDQVCGVAGGCRQAFQGGGIWSHPTAGTHAVATGIVAAWAASGAESGALGYPTTPRFCGLRDSACGQGFQGGRVFTSPATGTHAVAGAVNTAWEQQGLERGPLGLPVSPLYCGLKETGCVQAFQGGRVYSTPGSGTHALTGAVNTAWGQQGYENGPLGYATGDLVCGLPGGGCTQAFQGGVLSTHPTAGTHQLSGPIAAAWQAAGAAGGALGQPTSPQFCGLKENGCVQAFQGGRVYTTPGSGAHALTGAIQTAWAAQGYERGPLGYATGDLVCGLPGGGCTQAFQGGVLSTHPTAGTHQLSGPIAAAWQAAGAAGGALGQPTSPQFCGLKENGCVQAFQGGRVYTTPGSGAHALTGAIQTAWAAQGYERGPLGYATSDPYAVAGGTAQDFQGGRLTLDTGTGQVTRS